VLPDLIGKIACVLETLQVLPDLIASVTIFQQSNLHDWLRGEESQSNVDRGPCYFSTNLILKKS